MLRKVLCQPDCKEQLMSSTRPSIVPELYVGSN